MANEIAKAILAAQKEMGNATKGSSNPFFKSKYADLNAIREACMPALHNNGMSVLQPTVHIDGKNFIKTILLHESGETFEGLTEIIYSKSNDAQAQGSGITYARRYGLQSLMNIGADDDDGNKASQPMKVKTNEPNPYQDWIDELAKIKSIIGLGDYYTKNHSVVDSNKEVKALFTKRRIEIEADQALPSDKL